MTQYHAQVKVLYSMGGKKSGCGWSIPDLCRIAENIKDCDDIAGIEDASKVKRADVPVIYPDVVVSRVESASPPEFIRLN